MPTYNAALHAIHQSLTLLDARVDQQEGSVEAITMDMISQERRAYAELLSRLAGLEERVKRLDSRLGSSGERMYGKSREGKSKWGEFWRCVTRKGMDKGRMR